MTRKEKDRLVEFAAELFARMHPEWDRWPTPKNYWFACAMFVQRKPECVLRISYEANTKNDEFHIGVGWCESEAEIFESRATKPHRPGDGHLARIRKLERSREFTYPDYSKPIGVLIRPGVAKSYSLTDDNKEEVAAEMLSDVEEYGLPYLDLMLAQKRSESMDRGASSST